MKIPGESHDFIIVIIKAVISVNLLDIQRNINMYYYRIETPLRDNPPFFWDFQICFHAGKENSECAKVSNFGHK